MLFRLKKTNSEKSLEKLELSLTLLWRKRMMDSPLHSLLTILLKKLPVGSPNSIGKRWELNSSMSNSQNQDRSSHLRKKEGTIVLINSLEVEEEEEQKRSLIPGKNLRAVIGNSTAEIETLVDPQEMTTGVEVVKENQWSVSNAMEKVICPEIALKMTDPSNIRRKGKGTPKRPRRCQRMKDSMITDWFMKGWLVKYKISILLIFVYK